MRLRKKKVKMEDIGDMDYTPDDEQFFKEQTKKNLQTLAEELTERTKRETELIRQHLGIDPKGCCLRHPNQFITGKVQPNRRFETIKICLICDSEIQAGGKAQRKSMTNVISDLDKLIEDKTAWRNKTNVLYNGQTILEEEEDEDEADNKNVFKKWVPPSNEEENKEFAHMLSFYNKEVEEVQAKIRKSSARKLTTRISTSSGSTPRESKIKIKVKKEEGDDEVEEVVEVSEEVLQQEDNNWKEEVKQRVAHVRAWDGDMALKQNPVYAKFFRMADVGIPKPAISQAMQADGLDPRILVLDPNRPLQDQVDDIPDMDEEEKEKLRRNDQLALMRDDDIYEPLTIDETVEMIHRAYERRAYFMQELDDERNPDKQKLSKKFLKKVGVGVRAPPPPLIEPKRRELPPKPEAEEVEKEEKPAQVQEPPAKISAVKEALEGKEGKYVSKPQLEGRGYNVYGMQLKAKLNENTSQESDGENLAAPSPPPPPIPRPEEVKRNSSRVSFGATNQVVTTEDIDSSIRGEKALALDTPNSMSTMSHQPSMGTPSPRGSSPMHSSPTSTTISPMAFFPDPDDKLPDFSLEPGKRVKKKLTMTKLGSTKYEVARTKHELNQAKKELVQRTVIIGSLQTQLENLQKELKRKEREVEEMKEELHDLDPRDPLCRQEVEPEREEFDGTFREIDRSEVVKARMAKLSLLPRPALPR